MNQISLQSFFFIYLPKKRKSNSCISHIILTCLLGLFDQTFEIHHLLAACQKYYVHRDIYEELTILVVKSGSQSINGLTIFRALLKMKNCFYFSSMQKEGKIKLLSVEWVDMKELKGTDM